MATPTMMSYMYVCTLLDNSVAMPTTMTYASTLLDYQHCGSASEYTGQQCFYDNIAITTFKNRIMLSLALVL